MKIWILFLCVVVVGVTAQSDESVDEWDDDWKEYDDEWFRTRLAQLGIYNDEQKDPVNDGDANIGDLERDQDEMDKKVEEDIKKSIQEIKDEDEGEDKIDDYQFEDNRSEQSEELGADNKAEPLREVDDGNNQDINQSESENDYDDYALNVDDLEANISENEGLQIPGPEFSKDDDIAPLPSAESNEEIKRIIDEAQAIINQEAEKLNDFDVKDESKEENSDELNGIIKETKAILEENMNPNDFAPSNEEIKQIMDETQAIINQEEESPNDFYDGDVLKQENSDDLNEIVKETNAILKENLRPNDFAADTMQNRDTVEELNNDSNIGSDTENEEELPNVSQNTSIQQEEVNEDDNSSDDVEDKNEDTVDKVYEDLNDDLDTLFETLDKLSRSDDDEDGKLKPADVDYAVNSDESLDDKPDYENIFDSNLSDLFGQHSKSKNNEDFNNHAENEPNDSENDEPINDALDVKKSEKLELGAVPYINDALLSENNIEEKSVKSVNVDELSDSQLVQLMKDFEIQHSDVFDVDSLSDNHIVNEITLEYGETKVITSENYPDGYPTNRVVDWIITGKGQGIELNVTDFTVNSALGDYLMVKPGQIDDSGSEGIIFSYRLNEPRAFRFMDVDRIFIRFDSKLGMSFLRGFSLTVKVIAPTEEEPEPEPEPEPLLPEPRHTLQVLLGGVTLAEFQENSEQFRQLIADMATMYINANGIEPGLNTTAEITQLISASICNVHWPGFEQCVQVQFSVPLVYEDDDEQRLNGADLQAMWETYVEMDPFAARLRQMGIEEFSVPNDSGVLTVWLVVALGVVISAAMLAFALWRYSCIENYSRMPAHSDTDSLYEKRNSALYPTPHQMLPPLYAEKDYDSTRVDMGGYTNRSYARTDMYDLDSDEDAVPRDRNAGIQPRDIFSV